MHHKIRKFAALDWDEQWLLLQSLLLLALTAFALRVFGYKRSHGWLAKSLQPSVPGAGTERIDRTVKNVERAASVLPFATCLPQSLTLWWLLRRQGIASYVRMGVQKEADRLHAHAWVEYEGSAPDSTKGLQNRFTPFDVPITFNDS